VQKRATGSPRSVDELFGKHLKRFAVVRVFVWNDVDQTSPASAYADDAVTFTERPNRNGANGWVEPRHIAPTCENANR
jgi:hypothetical protein